MKNFKKIAGIMLALVMVLAMAVPAFAAETATDPTTAPTTGSIKITNPAEGENYAIYKMFTLESYDKGTKTYTYQVTPEWKDFVTTGAGQNYLQLVDGVYVTVKDGETITDNSDKAVALAKDALAYVQTVNGNDGNTDNDITAVATLPNTTATDDKKYVAEGLDLGYYLVDSSLGTLCGLTTTDATVDILDKNGAPEITKEVKENSTSQFGASNTANMGDIVEFKTTIKVADGAENYVLHDTMDATLSLLTDDTHKITVTVGGTAVEAGENTYTIPTTTDGHTFDIQFADAYVDTLSKETEVNNKTIVVSYFAKLTTAAVAGVANVNKTHLTYGSNSQTTEKTTSTYTYSVDLVKTKKDNNVLDGAEFALYTAAEGGTKINVVKVAGTDGLYRKATADDAASDYAVIQAGKATITGLDKGTYYLEETKAPSEYNKLTARKSFEIVTENLVAEYTDEAKTVYSGGGVQVINYKGGILPSTGGIGTMIFYIVGGILLVGAGVLLVVRKRMNAENKNK